MIEDFFGTGRQPGIARLTWKASGTLRGSKRVHFAGITGFQSRECQMAAKFGVSLSAVRKRRERVEKDKPESR